MFCPCRRRRGTDVSGSPDWPGFDMTLTKNGHWIARCVVPAAHMRAQYVAATHTIHLVSSLVTTESLASLSLVGADSLLWWPWAIISINGRTYTGLSDFFHTLRYTEGLSLSAEDVLLLYGHQKGWYPTDELEITLQSGIIERVVPFSSLRHSRSQEDIQEIHRAIEYIR